MADKKPRSEKQLANDQRLRDLAAARREQKSQNKNPENILDMVKDTTSEVPVQEPGVTVTSEQPNVQNILTDTAPDETEVAGVAPTESLNDTVTQPDYGELQRQIQELKDMQWAFMKGALAQDQDQQAPTQGGSGKLTGTFIKYAMDPALYPSPVERLAQEPKLARFAFPLNYELQYEIEESAYETIDHIRTKEPRFTLTLVKIMLDEETGDDSGGRYDICRIIMHEDPTTALVIAQQEGIDVESMDEKVFLNEMRYVRMRDWLLDCFYPPKITTQKQKRDMVISGRLVQYWEKNVEDGEAGITKVDWDKLPKIKF